METGACAHVYNPIRHGTEKGGIHCAYVAIISLILRYKAYFEHGKTFNELPRLQQDGVI